MKGNLIFGILLEIIIISGVSAALSVLPSERYINMTVNGEKFLDVAFYNNFPYPIYNISMESASVRTQFTPILEIATNETAIRQLKIMPNSPFIGESSFKFYFFYFTNTTISPSTNGVFINQNGFFPNSITVYKGSTIIWTNNASIIQNVNDLAGEFNSGDIMPSASYSRIFNTVKTYTIRNSYTGNTMLVYVLDNVQQVPTRNPDYDVQINLSFSVIYPQTNITSILTPASFVTFYNEKKEGVVQVQNTGTMTALKVHLFCEWCQFDKNDLDISSGETKFFVFKIIPKVSSTEDTGKSYTFGLTVRGDNTNALNHTISVYVNRSEISALGLNGSIPDRDWLMNTFCPAYPTSFLCNQTPQVQYVEIPMNETPINVSWTVADVASIKTDIARISTDYRPLFNFIKEIFYDLNRTKQEQTEIIANMNSTISDLHEKEKRREYWTIFGFLVVFMMTVCGIGGYFVYSMLKKKNIFRGGNY